MEGTTQIRLEIDLAAERLITQHILTNERVREDIMKGVKEACENFDFTAMVKKKAEEKIIKAVEATLSRSMFSIQEKVSSILEGHVERALAEVVAAVK